MMSRCERCGKPLDTVRCLTNYVPHRKLGFRISGEVRYASEYMYPVCIECSRAFESFMRGEEIPAIERGCRNCGSLKVEDGCAFCPDCGAKVVDGR